MQSGASAGFFFFLLSDEVSLVPLNLDREEVSVPVLLLLSDQPTAEDPVVSASTDTVPEQPMVT